MIEIGKTYQARCGWEARVHATDLGHTFYPVLATILDPDKGWGTVHLTANGNFITTGGPHDFDLVEVKPVITLMRWVNVYRDVDGQDEHCTFLHLTEDQAIADRNVGCIMTVPVTITGYGGDGL